MIHSFLKVYQRTNHNSVMCVQLNGYNLFVTDEPKSILPNPKLPVNQCPRTKGSCQPEVLNQLLSPVHFDAWIRTYTVLQLRLQIPYIFRLNQRNSSAVYIGPVHFMVGDNRLSRVSWDHTQFWTMHVYSCLSKIHN